MAAGNYQVGKVTNTLCLWKLKPEHVLTLYYFQVILVFFSDGTLLAVLKDAAVEIR